MAGMGSGPDYEAQVAESAEIAHRWLADDYGPRGPYTQVHLKGEEDIAATIAEIALTEKVTIAEATRILLRLACKHLVR